jgi:hypothetical protein
MISIKKRTLNRPEVPDRSPLDAHTMRAFCRIISISFERPKRLSSSQFIATRRGQPVEPVAPPQRGRQSIALEWCSLINGEVVVPELPDVEHFKRVLVQNGLDRIIKSVVVKDARILGEVSAEAFTAHLRGRRLVAVGNIYSDEILFQARIAPTTGIAKLPPARLKQLFLETRKVLKTAIECDAGSEQFVERMPRGSLLPERKKGGHCPRCRSPLKIFKVGGRTAYCCPHCQS